MKLDINGIKPVRNPGWETSAGSRHCLAYSSKMNRHISVESSLEADAVWVIDAIPQIDWFCEQPGTFEIEHDGRVVNYTPDFLLRHSGKFTFVEVKPAKKAASQKYESFFKSVRKHYEAQGVNFVVWTEQLIRCEPRLSNVKTVSRLAQRPCNEGHMILIRELTDTVPSLTVGELNTLSAANDNLPNAYSIIKHGFGMLDMSQPINDNARVVFRNK